MMIIAVIAGGPFNHRYKLIQFHAHWGKDCNCGSEHIIDGKPYSAEVSGGLNLQNNQSIDN